MGNFIIKKSSNTYANSPALGVHHSHFNKLTTYEISFNIVHICSQLPASTTACETNYKLLMFK